MNLGGNHGYHTVLSACFPSPTCLTAISRRPSHGATMRNIGHKSWSKAWRDAAIILGKVPDLQDQVLISICSYSYLLSKFSAIFSQADRKSVV